MRTAPRLAKRQVGYLETGPKAPTSFSHKVGGKLVTYSAAKPQDLKDLVEFAVVGLQTMPISGLVISMERVREMATLAISNPKDYCWIGRHDGKIVAAVTGIVTPMDFYERMQVTVVQCWAEMRGAGVPLLDHFLAWARSRRAIKCIIFPQDPGADPRIGHLLERKGLSTQSAMFMEFR